MPVPPPSRPTLAASTSRSPGEFVVAVVSVALAVYLVGLALSIAGNSVSGSSALLRTIKSRLFVPWMAPAWLDLGFDYPLTYGMPEDAEHMLELRGRGSSGEPIRLPGELTGERAARWRRLARRITLAGSDDAAAGVAAGVGSGGFARCDADDVIVRVLRTPLADREGPSVPPRLEQAYAARVRWIDGELQLIELGGETRRSELAPLVPQPAASGDRDAAEDGSEASP